MLSGRKAYPAMVQRMSVTVFVLVGRIVDDKASYDGEGYKYSFCTEMTMLNQPETCHERGRPDAIGKPW